MTILARANELETFIAAIFGAAGSEAGEAAEIAAHLVDANLAGHDSHGVGMVPVYLEHLKAGLVRPNQRPARVGGAGSFAVFDGGLGYGQPVANAVTDEAAAIAAEHGVAIVTLRNAHHVGRIGAYAERLAARGLMSI
ncbi:MAG: Ldh family oxidoreductase, partial [Burkholderiaceae bacterium]|nr:Ldh family oxidoreductase [Burkholderiaceae bacterium]